jgi:chromosome segregation ATPase
MAQTDKGKKAKGSSSGINQPGATSDEHLSTEALHGEVSSVLKKLQHREGKLKQVVDLEKSLKDTQHKLQAETARADKAEKASAGLDEVMKLWQKKLSDHSIELEQEYEKKLASYKTNSDREARKREEIIRQQEQKKYEDTLDENEELKDEVQTLEDQLLSFESGITSLSAKLENVQALLEKSEAKTKMHHQEIERMKSDISETEAIIIVNKKQINLLETEKNRLEGFSKESEQAQ